jgi:acetylglutamate kinase
MKDALLLKILKQALPYLRKHKRQVMVIKLGGELAARPELLHSLAEDISLLMHVGIRIVVVHGGGPQATEVAKRMGIASTMVEGRRVTDEQTLDVAKMVFGGKINTEILSALLGQGVNAVGLSGVDAGILSATRRRPTEMTCEETGEKKLVDFGFVGDVQAVDSTLLSLLMDNGYVPVLASLGADAHGKILNINADTVASVIAQDLKAGKLISLTSVPGVLRDKDDPESLVTRLTASEARQALTDGTVASGMKPKVAAVVDAVENGVTRGHILSGLEHGTVLMELFTREGCGTLIVGENEGEQVEAAAHTAAADSSDAIAAALGNRPGARRIKGRRGTGAGA